MIPLILIVDGKTNIGKFLKNKFPHAYTFYLLPETSEYSINQIRALTKETAFNLPYLRLYVLENFDHSSLEAQNAFLKLLEEPPTNVQFVLTTSNLYRLLDTIRSRCQITNQQTRRDVIDHVTINNVFNEIIKKGINSLGNPDFVVGKKEEAGKIIDQLIYTFRKNLPHDRKAALILKECLQSKSLLENNNVNPQLSIDHLLIFIAKKYSMK